MKQTIFYGTIVFLMLLLGAYVFFQAMDRVAIIQQDAQSLHQSGIDSASSAEFLAGPCVSIITDGHLTTTETVPCEDKPIGTVFYEDITSKPWIDSARGSK